MGFESGSFFGKAITSAGDLNGDHYDGRSCLGNAIFVSVYPVNYLDSVS